MYRECCWGYEQSNRRQQPGSEGVSHHTMFCIYSHYHNHVDTCTTNSKLSYVSPFYTKKMFAVLTVTLKLQHQQIKSASQSLIINPLPIGSKQEAPLSPRDRAMRRVSWNLANCHATVQKLLIRQVLTKSMVWSWRFSRRQCVINMCTQPRRDRVALIVL